MELDTFLVCDSLTTENGKLYILGGGVTRLNVGSFPFALPTLGLAIRLRAERHDAGQQFGMRLEMLAPHGETLFPPLNSPVGPVEFSSNEDEENFLTIALTFGPVIFSDAGVYRLRLMLDERELRVLPLPVVPAALSTETG